VVSRIFRLARKLKLYHDENPAHDIAAGAKPIIKRRPGYTWANASLALGQAGEPGVPDGEAVYRHRYGAVGDERLPIIL
jgi:hypothetical protein